MVDDPIRILVLDDSPAQCIMWERLIVERGALAQRVVGYTQETTAELNEHSPSFPGNIGVEIGEMLRRVCEILDNDDKGFDGTILDMNFPGDPLGGITLWNILNNGQRMKLGIILVACRARKVEIQEFAAQHAKVYFEALTSAGRRDCLDKLLAEIQRVRDSEPPFSPRYVA